ncbi:MAG: biopolymer transporter ExbD [Phycisphaerales bacterium]|nr:biopolymer transporter ExbD [Phycisphaerales bacterium]
MAAKLRTSLHEPRLEMTPLLDVVFLLLTFFAFSMLVMVRADVVDVDLPVIDPTGSTATGPAPIVVSLTSDDRTAVNGEFFENADVPQAVTRAVAAQPEAPVVLEVDIGSASGRLIELVQQLRAAGIESFGILGSGGEVGASAVPSPVPAP